MTTAYAPTARQMVSHPYPPPPYSVASSSTVTLQQPPPRRPSSISSRSTSHSHSRRHGHRSGRTQHSTSSGSYRPQNEFPNFAQTGDVEIVLTVAGEERRYMLHRLILSQCSRVLQRGMSEEWERMRAGGNAHGSLARIREEHEGRQSGEQRQIWRYELDWSGEQGDVPMLVQKPSPAAAQQSLPPPPIPNRPPANANLPFRSLANHQAMNSTMSIPQQPAQQANPDSTILQDYDNLLRIFYNYPPFLDNANIATSYLQCKSLLLLADMYDALQIVGPRIDHHLLQFQSRLWKQIAKYPPSYLKLGYLARSKVIFQEALCHVVGQWPAGSRQLGHSVPEDVLDLIEDKVDELAESKAAIEAQLWKLNLTTSRGERVGPSNAYLDWLALSLFRTHLGDGLSPPSPPPPQRSDRHRPPPPPQPRASGLASSFFRSLSASSYLSHDECKKFIRLAPLPDRDSSTRETLKRFERKLDELKSQAREVVRPLMRSYLELDVGAGGLGYLTCTKVNEEEFPWD